MLPLDALRLVALSTLWGVSFIFMRVAVPEFGAVSLIFIRMGVAALLLSPLLLSRNHLAQVWQYKAPLAVLSLTNHVLPFSLLAYATLSLEAGFTSLINATTPLFTALIGMMFFATAVTRQQYVGLAIAFVGVYVLSGNRLDFSVGGDGWSILAALAATLCYGVAGNFTKKKLSHLPVQVVAGGSTMLSALILLIPGLMLWPETMPSMQAWMNTLALALFSTALAFLIYFQLLSSAGATATSTVTFLVPVSALGWGYVFLGETISLTVWLGMAITLFGTAITTRLIRFGRPKPASDQAPM
jgi:drug/metabolite transporter (DMT)-like permease